MADRQSVIHVVTNARETVAIEVFDNSEVHWSENVIDLDVLGAQDEDNPFKVLCQPRLVTHPDTIVGLVTKNFSLGALLL